MGVETELDTPLLPCFRKTLMWRPPKKRLNAHEGDLRNTLTEMVHRVKWGQPVREIRHSWPFHVPHNFVVLGG